MYAGWPRAAQWYSIIVTTGAVMFRIQPWDGCGVAQGTCFNLQRTPAPHIQALTLAGLVAALCKGLEVLGGRERGQVRCRWAVDDEHHRAGGGGIHDVGGGDGGSVCGQHALPPHQAAVGWAAGHTQRRRLEGVARWGRRGGCMLPTCLSGRAGVQEVPNRCMGRNTGGADKNLVARLPSHCPADQQQALSTSRAKPFFTPSGAGTCPGCLGARPHSRPPPLVLARRA